MAVPDVHLMSTSWSDNVGGDGNGGSVRMWESNLRQSIMLQTDSIGHNWLFRFHALMKSNLTSFCGANMHSKQLSWLLLILVATGPSAQDLGPVSQCECLAIRGRVIVWEHKSVLEVMIKDDLIVRETPTAKTATPVRELSFRALENVRIEQAHGEKAVVGGYSAQKVALAFTGDTTISILVPDPSGFLEINGKQRDCPYVVYEEGLVPTTHASRSVPCSYPQASFFLLFSSKGVSQDYFVSVCGAGAVSMLYGPIGSR